MSTHTVTCSNPFHRHTTVNVSGTEKEVSFTLDTRRGTAVATDVPADVADVLAENPAYTVHDQRDEPTQDDPTQDEPAGDDRAQDEPDDLTALSGVGPATAETLQEAGITTFAALAEATAVDGLSDDQVDELRGKAQAHL